MSASKPNHLIFVWAFLTAITLASWLFSRAAGTAFQINATVTVAVLLMAALKAHLVIRYFMEVRSAPDWLKRTTGGWVVALSVLLLAICLAGSR